MPSFDIAYSNRLPAVTQMPRANVNVDTGAGMIGQALSNLGGAINQIGTQYQEANNAIALSKAKRRYDEINAAAYNALDKVTTEEESQKVLSQYQADVAGLKSGNSWVDQRFDMHVNDTITGVTQQFADKVQKNNIRKLNDDFKFNLENSQSSGDFKNADELINQIHSIGEISTANRDYLLTENRLKRQKFELDQNISSTLDMAVKAAGPELNKDNAYKVINESSLPMDDKISLGNRIDSYVAGQAKKKSDDKYQNELNFTTGFVKAIGDNDLDANMIEKQYPSNAGQDKVEKDKYYAVLMGFNDTTTPQRMTAIGGGIARQTVLDVSSGKLATKNAYDDLMKARYVDKTIDDSTYAWAVKHIEKPYPDVIINDMKAQLISNREKIKSSSSFFNPLAWGESGAEADKSNQVNNDLMKWVDVQLENKKTPTAKEMYLRSQELIAGAKLTGGDTTAKSTKPTEYPDAVWNEKHQTWTVTRNGRLMGVK